VPVIPEDKAESATSKPAKTDRNKTKEEKFKTIRFHGGDCQVVTNEFYNKEMLRLPVL